MECYVKNKKLVSIIIPVYNVEKYLDKCINSVRNQTYKHLEIILVDDGSIDNSGRICDRYQKVDSRIIVIHKNNGGLSDARNTALDIVTGDYVLCVDSDDYITKDCVEYLINLLEKTKSDISICQMKKIFAEETRLDCLKEKINIYENVIAMEQFLYQRLFTASAWCKLYKRQIFKDIRYPVGYYYEDFAIICKILDCVKKVAVSNQQKYYYRQHHESIMGEGFNSKKMHRIYVAEWNKEFINKKYPWISDAADARCFLSAVQTFREIPFKKENKEYVQETWEIIREYRGKILKNPKVKLSHKIMALCIYL